MFARINAIGFALIGLFAHSIHAQEVMPRFTIDTPSQTRTGCAMRSLTADGTLTVEEGGRLSKLSGFVEIRQEATALPPMLHRNFVSLTNGDRLPLKADAVPSITSNRLVVWPASSLPGFEEKGLELFVPHVVLLFLSVPEGVDSPERFFTELQNEGRRYDVAHLKNGDRIEGTLVALSAKSGCVILAGGRRVQTPFAKLAGIAFNTDRQARLRTKSPYARVVLEGGARLNLLETRFDEKTRHWLGKTQYGSALNLPEASVLAIDVRQGLAVDLADLTPARYEHRPYLATAWPLSLDAAATGAPLRLADSTFERGLGMHASCRVEYKLDGKYQRFDALVGIDEPSHRGRARVAIELDGKRIDLNDGKELTSRTMPIAVRLNVKGMRTMTLIVDVGSFGDVQANVNWAKARLIKNER